MRLSPWREDRDRPADRRRLLLRLRVPGADLGRGSRGDREGDPPRDRVKAASGRAKRSLADEAIARFSAEGQPYKVELIDDGGGRQISLYTQGEIHGSLPRPSPPERGADQGGQADEPRRRLLARRREAPELTRIYGTAFYSQAELDAHLERLEQARGARPPQARRPAGSLPSVRALARLAVLAPERGMVLLERSSRTPPPREPTARLRRGEDAARCTTSRRYRDVGPLGELRGEHVLRARARGRGAASR